MSRSARDTGDLLTGAFEAAALARFAQQYDEIAAFRGYCDVRKVRPDTCTDWRDVPLMPVSAFRTAVLSTAASAAAATHVFETSGTTAGQPGTVRLSDTSYYDAAIDASFAEFVVPDRRTRFTCISLLPPASVRPRSSLGYMVERLVHRFGQGNAICPMLPTGAVDVPALRRALASACEGEDPVLVFATTIALDVVSETWPPDVRMTLPPGSRVMDTGGPKGRVRIADRASLRVWAAEHWGVPQALFVGELGMTELASQRYETTARHALVGDIEAHRVYVGPPWLRSLVVDPMTLRPVEQGAPGLVGHVDLANLQTCAFILTSDLGRLVTVESVTGPRIGLELLGRAPNSHLRGCGLDAELL